MGRRYSPVELPDGMRGWVIHWEPGEDTGWHDHGESVARVIVVRGVYIEMRLTRPVRYIELSEGEMTTISHREIHRVMPERPCTAIHIYTPELEYMDVYDSRGKKLRSIPGMEEL